MAFQPDPIPHKYFITGAFGFLGQHIVQAVCQHDPDAQVVLLVRRPRSLHLPVDQLPQVTIVKGDLSAVDSYRPALQGVHTVIHNAALVSFRRADAQALFRANLSATENLLQAAAENGCQNFIFISSISSIGRAPAAQPPALADENTQPDLEEKQKDAYGYSKLLAEGAARGFTDRMRVIILNPSVIIGPGSERISTALRWLQRLPILPLTATLNSFVEVRDVAHAVVLALSRGRSGERYIVTSWNIDQVSFARLALRLMGKRTPVLPVSGWVLRLGDGLVAALDALRINPGLKKITAMSLDKAYSSARIQAELGWQPQYTLEQSLADTLAALKPGQKRA